MERPDARRAAVFGAVTALAFLFRHDHGVYLGGIAVLAFALTRLAEPRESSAPRSFTPSLHCRGVWIVAPWPSSVQLNEGLPEHAESRAKLYRFWSPASRRIGRYSA